MSNYMSDIIRNALIEIGSDELFNRIDKAKSSYHDVLVWYNPETKKIDVDPIRHCDNPSPKDDRILLYRDDDLELYDRNLKEMHWKEKWPDILDSWPKLAANEAFLGWLREEDKIIAEDDVYALWDEILDEYPVIICGLEYSAAYILKEIDPVTYRCGFLDFINGQYEQLCDHGFESNDYVECSHEEFDELIEKFNNEKEEEDE